MRGRVDQHVPGRRRWVAAAAVAATLGLATNLRGQETSPVPPVPPSGATEARGGPREGIKVHGHWTVTVRNADGSIASRTEFENALVASGGQLLAGLLTRGDTLERMSWRVALVGGAATYLIAEGEAGPNRFPNLVVSAVAGSPALTATGSAKAAAANDLATVRTELEARDSAGLISRVTAFTSKALAAPIAVQAGQTIDVTVVLSFS